MRTTSHRSSQNAKDPCQNSFQTVIRGADETVWRYELKAEETVFKHTLLISTTQSGTSPRSVSAAPSTSEKSAPPVEFHVMSSGQQEPSRKKWTVLVTPTHSVGLSVCRLSTSCANLRAARPALWQVNLPANKPAKSIEQVLWEGNGFSCSQEVPCIVWHPMFVTCSQELWFCSESDDSILRSPIFPEISRYIIVPSAARSCVRSHFIQVSQSKQSVVPFLFSPGTYEALFDLINNTWRGVQIVKLLIKFCQSSFYFIPVMSNKRKQNNFVDENRDTKSKFLLHEVAPICKRQVFG
jgi:hypothetical protein